MTGINGKNNQDFFNEILLVDSLTTADQIKVLLNQFPNLLIISFDYDSHNLLERLNISHKISEDFSSNSLFDLQSKIYDFSNWYQSNELSSTLYFMNLNYGKLFHEEIIDLLVSFLKKFYEIKFIYEKFPNSKYFGTSTLFDIISNFSSSVIQLHNENSVEFANNKIRYNLNIKNKHMIFYLSRKTYFRIKHISEIFLHLFFKPVNKKQQKYSMLVEFDTLRYKNIFLESAKTNIQILFYGRRRPSIWNKTSFDVFKHSNSKIVTSYYLSDKTFEQTVKSRVIELSVKLNNLLKSDSFFNNYFSIDGISFWHSLKPTFSKLLQERSHDVVLEISYAEKLFEKCNISNVLILSEVGFTEQIIISQAKRKNIPIILFQMGLNYDTKEAYSMNKSQSVYPVDADKFVVWGQIYENDAKVNGDIDPKKILQLGSPRFDDLIFHEKTSNNEYILLATSGPQREDLKGISVKNIEKYIDTIKKICEIVKSQNKKLIIKLHPSWAELDVSQIAKTIDSEIIIVSSGDISELIKSCELMICTGLSTAILEAQILQKPVISIPVIDYGWGNPTIFNSNSCVICDVKDLKNILNKFNDIEFKKLIVCNANNFLKQCLINHKSASKKIIDYLKTYD